MSKTKVLLFFSLIISVLLAPMSAKTEWIKYSNNPILNLGLSGSWDDYNVSNQSVIKDGDIYKMWYEGFDGSKRYIGYATSTDGINWIKYSGNPIFYPGTENWENGLNKFGQLKPYVVKEDNTFKMWFTGISSSNEGAIGYAISSDGIPVSIDFLMILSSTSV